MNISAVLRELGLPTIQAKAQAHYQNAIFDAIERHLRLTSASWTSRR